MKCGETGSSRRGGFTLLELIAVIGIMAIMVTLAVGGFSGMMAATTESTAFQTLQRAFNLARQEACVEGSDTYVFVVDMDRFAIVRKAGTVSRTETGEQAWGAGGGRLDPKAWIVDDYADLADRQEARDGGSAELSQEERDAIAADYDGILVFDISKGIAARVKSPARWVDDLDAWVFAIEDLGGDAPATAARFERNDRYGWITHPVYSMPDGWVFRGSYYEKGEKAGLFNHKDIKVHFTPGGDVAPDSTTMPIVVENPSRGWSFEITVDNAGVSRNDKNGKDGNP